MSPTRHPIAAALAVCLALLCAAPARAVTATGRLQVIQLDVGQGDGALIISPLGATVLIDEGPSGVTPAMGVSVLNQLRALGVTRVDHHFASHYHADHIGNFLNIINGGIPIDLGWDRGGSYTTATYNNYANNLAIGNRRRTLVKNQVITLDSLSAHPVFIKCVDLAGAGAVPTPSDENSLCLVLKVSYGEYDQVFGGDLTGGAEGSSSPDIESRVAAAVGVVEAYKVHHHGSRFSSNANFLSIIAPRVAVISCGNGNSYGHPTSGALGRLHAANVKTYWTETGAGVAPNASWDKVSNGQVTISATWEPGGVDSIRGNGFAHTFTNSGTALDVTAPLASLASPDGGEVWKVGSSHPLQWTASDAVGVTAVDLGWSATGAAPWSPIATGIANSGSFAWTIPAQPTANGRVRVMARDAAGNAGADSSLAAFSVDYWTITAAAGSGGSVAPSGIVPVSEGASSNFTITPGSGWQIAGVIVDGDSVGAVSSYPFIAVSAHHTLSASFLDVAAPAVTVTSPAGGESWEAGSVHAVTWNATDNLAVDSVTIEYSLAGLAGPWSEIARGISNSGSRSWTLPLTSTDSARVRVTAFDPSPQAGAGTSASSFRIGSGSVSVGDDAPVALALANPLPNPTGGTAWLGFSMPRAGDARIELLDLSGRRVWQSQGWVSAGQHRWRWDGRAEAGLYFVRLTTSWGTRTTRLVKLR